MLEHWVRGLQTILLQNLASIRQRGGIGHPRPGGDGRRVVAGHIGDEQVEKMGRGTSLGQATTFDGGEVLAQAVDLADSCAGSQELGGERLLVFDSHPSGRQRQQCGAASGEESDDEVVRAETRDQGHHAPGGVEPQLVRDGVRGFEYLDALAGQAITVASDHQAGELAGPGALKGLGHGGGGLAGPDHDRTAPGRRGEGLRQYVLGCDVR